MTETWHDLTDCHVCPPAMNGHTPPESKQAHILNIDYVDTYSSERSCKTVFDSIRSMHER